MGWFGGGGLILPQMVRIGPGRFLMGAPEGEDGASSIERPQHEVAIDYHEMAIDERMALAMYRSLRAEIDDARLADAGPLIHPLRSRKSPAELAQMRHAKAITLEVHRRAHLQLHAGQRASEVVRFIDDQHRALGGSGNSF